MAYAIHYDPQAEAALSSLDSDERSRLIASIHQLAGLGVSDPRVARLNGTGNGTPSYVLRAPDDLRVVFTASRDRITVLDVLNKRFAERYG